MEKTIIGDATISRARITTKETDEQRRIAALEERVAMLETALAYTQTQTSSVEINVSRVGIVD